MTSPTPVPSRHPLTLAEHHQAGDDAPVVLLLHGGAGPESLAELVEHLAPVAHVLLPTHPGWRGTPRADRLDSVGELAQLYLDLLADRGLRDATVIGSSFGGWIAAELTARDAATFTAKDRRVARLVLMDAIGPELPGHDLEPPSPPPAPSPDGADPTPAGPRPADMAALRAYVGRTFHDPTLLSRLRQADTPVLLIWGENDTVVSPAFARAYAAALPADLVVVPGAGHVPTREAPAAVFAEIATFRSSDPQ